MLKSVYSFLVVLLLMFSGEIYAQFEVLKTPQIVSPSTIYIKKGNIGSQLMPSLPIIMESAKKNEIFVSLKSQFIQISIPSSINPISQSLYADALSFICKKEWQLEKITSVPFRFRLGSLDYVNFLEQKPNVIKPAQ